MPTGLAAAVRASPTAPAPPADPSIRRPQQFAGQPDRRAPASCGEYQGAMGGSIMPRMVKNSSAASRPEAGTVMTQAAAILSRAERLTSSWR